MAVTISQNLSVPAGLADGQTTSASQILPLYTALNAFVLPGTVGVFQQSFVDDVLYTLALGGTVTKDWAFTTTQPQAKAGFYLIPFSFSGVTIAALTFTYRINGTAVTAPQGVTTAVVAAGNGLTVAFVGAGHDADVPRPLLIFQLADDGTFKSVPANVALPAADITSFGITIGASTAGTANFKHVRFWSEG